MTTFGDIVDRICEALGVQDSDSRARNKIKNFVNLAYLEEVVPFKTWKWLTKTTTVVHKAYYNTGTVTVTPDTTAITFDPAPNSTLGSFKNYRFSVEGSNKVYTIATHTAGSASATLTGAFQEDLDEEATFKVWRDRLDLPTTAKETTELWHAERNKPLDAVGPQGFRKLEAANPKLEGFPANYNTTDFFDPSSDDSETESDRYRQVQLYPSISASPVTINVDYIEEATELTDDADEPLMPVSDRIVLYYLGGAMAWSIIGRNEDMHDRWLAKGNAKLARMAGDRDEGIDTPTLKPTSGYVNKIRRSGLRNRAIGVAAQGGTSSVSIPSYLRDTVIDGATLRDDLLVDDGVLIDGRDISEDGEIIDNLSSTTTVALPDNTANTVIASWLLTDDSVVHLQYSITRDTSIEAGSVTLVGKDADASIAQGAVTQIGDVGVTLTANIVGGALRLLGTTTSTGSAASFQYRLFKWLG